MKENGRALMIILLTFTTFLLDACFFGRFGRALARCWSWGISGSSVTLSSSSWWPWPWSSWPWPPKSPLCMWVNRSEGKIKSGYNPYSKSFSFLHIKFPGNNTQKEWITIKVLKFVNKGSIIIFHELICILFVILSKERYYGHTRKLFNNPPPAQAYFPNTNNEFFFVNIITIFAHILRPITHFLLDDKKIFMEGETLVAETLFFRLGFLFIFARISPESHSLCAECCHIVYTERITHFLDSILKTLGPFFSKNEEKSMFLSTKHFNCNLSQQSQSFSTT